MRVVFSMDGIKNMDLLYTWTEEYSEELGCTGIVEHYHGFDYCKSIIDTLTDWQEKKYIGCRDRISNEVFTFVSSTGAEYSMSFGISTYKTRSEQKIARLEVSIGNANSDLRKSEQQNETTQTIQLISPVSNAVNMACLLMKSCFRWVSAAIVDMNMNWCIVIGVENWLAKML